MKRNCIINVCLAFICFAATAQTSTQRIDIKGGNSAWENFMKEVFRYPTFENGLVEYKNGQRFKSKLNYNKVLGVVQFLDEKGDTLSMINEESISFLTIGNDAYIYAPNCLMALKADGKAKLYKNEIVRIADKRAGSNLLTG